MRRAPVCGLGFGGHDAGDGSAVFGIFIPAFGMVGIARYVTYLFSPLMWLHMVLRVPLIVGGGLLLQRPLKGLTIAILGGGTGALRRQLRRAFSGPWRRGGPSRVTSGIAIPKPRRASRKQIAPRSR